MFFGQFECFAVFVNMGALCSSGSWGSITEQ